MRASSALAARGKIRRSRSRLVTLGVVSLLILGGAAIAYRARSISLESRGTPGAPGTGAAEGFNLLLVSLDTVRADRLGCYGHAAAQTPNLDALAASGLRFAQAIAPAPLTMPSHATIMTGLDPPAHGVRDNGFRLAEAQTTLAEVLADQGYATAAFVGSFILNKRFGLGQGFATYDDECPPRDGSPGHLGEAAINERTATAVTDAAEGWLRAAVRDARPFFAWIHYFDAHHPYAPPRWIAKRSRDPYDGEIAYVDAQLGRVLRVLRESGAERQTLIVVAADHGEGLEEHGEPTHAYLLYDSTLRVPLILHCPALFGAGRAIDDRVVSLADIMPTVLDLLAAPAPPSMDGRHLLAGSPAPDRAIYIETMATRLNNGWASLHGLRRLHDKFILAPRPEYFDLRRDPHELQNLAASSPAEMAELDQRLAATMANWEPPDQVVAQAGAPSPETVRRLASLGYVGGAVGSTQGGLADPKDMMPLWKRVMEAEIQSLQGQHEQAVAEIERVVQEDPRDGHAWYYASYIYKRCGRMSDAEAALRRALALSPSAGGYVNLAQMLLVRRDLGADFEQTLVQAQRLESENGGIYVARGDWFMLQGRRDEALAAFEEALRRDPVNWGRAAREKIDWIRRGMH